MSGDKNTLSLQDKPEPANTDVFPIVAPQSPPKRENLRSPICLRSQASRGREKFIRLVFLTRRVNQLKPVLPRIRRSTARSSHLKIADDMSQP